MPSIDVLIKKVDQLPSIPAVIKRLIDLTVDPETDIKDILNLIEKDQSLTAGVLKMCNSSYYSLSRKVSSIHEAVVMLGFNTIANMCLTIGPSLYFRRNLWIYGLTGADLWRHSIATALCCEQLSHFMGDERIEITYTAGLLHDIGKLVLAEYDEHDLDKVMDLVKQGDSLVEAERQIVGMDHGVIGARLATRWKFPKTLVQAIKFHHEPDKAKLDVVDLCELVYIGNEIATQMESDTKVRLPESKQGADIFAKYEIGIEQMNNILNTVQDQVGDAETSLKEMQKAKIP